MSSQFQKMVLIPENASAQMYSGMKSVESHQTRLDSEMNQILSRTDLFIDEKWKMYQQALHRYLEYTPQSQKPIALPLLGSEETSPLPMIHHIISSVPKSLKRKTEVLLNLMQTSNRISWDQTGAVSIDNKVVPGSNIIDLVNDVLRRRTTLRNPIGITEFKQMLQAINIPLELVNFQFGGGSSILKVNTHTKTRKRSKVIKKRSKAVKKRISSIFKNFKEYKF